MSPLSFHRLIMFESLWSLTILFASYCPYVSLKLCLKAFLPIKSPWSRAGTWYPQHQDRHWLLSKQCCLSPDIHPSMTKKSQLTPETTESHILHNTLLINTIWLHPSPQWITLDWSLLIIAQTFQFFQYFEKTYINVSITSGWLDFLLLCIFGTLLTNTIQNLEEKNKTCKPWRVIKIIILKIAFWGTMPPAEYFPTSYLLFSGSEESGHRLDHFCLLCVGAQANSPVILCTSQWVFSGTNKILVWIKA